VTHFQLTWKTQLTEKNEPAKEEPMLWTLLVVLLILWALGFATATAGGLIHLLLVVALVVFVIQLVSGRRAV
jgi:uncharacterized membrane protein YtjA (UPF0391 family)